MDAITRAREFFRENGRDIDRARFEYHFGDLTQAHMLGVLERYQNRDGGFGKGLEPDIKAPDSNPFAMMSALLICFAANVPPDHELLLRAVSHLEQTQDEDGGWRFSPAVYEHELAPWFRGWEWPSLSPTCQLGGLLRELGLGSERLHSGVEGMFGRLARVEDLAHGEFYTVMPYAYYFLPEWEHPQRDLYLTGLLWWLIRHATAEKPLDAGHWFEYVRSPHTYTGGLMPSHVLAARLDELALEQADDGGWPSLYDDHWRGWITVQNLLVLQAFGRL